MSDDHGAAGDLHEVSAEDDDELVALIRYHERLAAVETMYANELRVARGFPLGPEPDLWPTRRGRFATRRRGGA